VTNLAFGTTMEMTIIACRRWNLRRPIGLHAKVYRCTVTLKC